MKNDLMLTNAQVAFCAKEQWAPQQVYGPGARPHFLLYVILDGKGILQFKNNIYQLQTRDVLFFAPGDKIYLEADEYTPWQITWAAFSGAELGGYLASSRFAKDPIWAVPVEEEQFITYALHLVDVFEKERSNPMEINGSLMQLLSFLPPRPKSRLASTREFYLARAKEYLENNYCYDIKIQDIAHQIGIDRSYVYRLFMELEHTSPSDYLLNCRLKHAVQLLESKQDSLLEIAYSCGFSDPESFQYHFQNAYHVSPEEYLWRK